jgi:hypothetical protein
MANEEKSKEAYTPVSAEELTKLQNALPWVEDPAEADSNKSLQEKLQDHYAAMRSEMEVEPSEDPLLSDKLYRIIAEAGEDAANTIVRLAKFADKDGVRLSASKHILHTISMRTGGAEDPLRRLLTQIMADEPQS